VILNANVGFLQAIGNGDPGSATQIASFLSTVASVGSIIIGLLLYRQNKTKDRESAVCAVSLLISCPFCDTEGNTTKMSYLTSMARPTVGLESLAIMYSLPYALIMWG
jgi:hypothetical protein